LQRGPTPAGPSFKNSRIPLKVIRAEAGTNAESVMKTYDDDEITSWSNNDQLANGWLRYELERTATIHEITMKLGNWRNRSYPLKVKIDDKEVFNGNTEQSLGYYTMKIPPSIGKIVTIELAGATASKDSFNSIVEVTGQKLESEDGTSKKGTLELVEIEFYEPAIQKH
jgi:beta-galactosidase